MECWTDWKVTNTLLIALCIKGKEGKRRRIMGFGKKMPFVESGGIFDERKFVTVEKSRIFM